MHFRFCEGQDARRLFAGVSRSYYGNEPLGGPALVRSFKSVMHASDSLRIVMLAVFLQAFRGLILVMMLREGMPW